MSFSRSFKASTQTAGSFGFYAILVDTKTIGGTSWSQRHKLGFTPDRRRTATYTTREEALAAAEKIAASRNASVK